MSGTGGCCLCSRVHASVLQGGVSNLTQVGFLPRLVLLLKGVAYPADCGIPPNSSMCCCHHQPGFLSYGNLSSDEERCVDRGMRRRAICWFSLLGCRSDGELVNC